MNTFCLIYWDGTINIQWVYQIPIDDFIPVVVYNAKQTRINITH